MQWAHGFKSSQVLTKRISCAHFPRSLALIIFALMKSIKIDGDMDTSGQGDTVHTF